MQTSFSRTQLADPDICAANDILRSCVHCGFCAATCPTFVLTGNELDSPRGRIYLIKEFLERGEAVEPALVTHVDRCLSCLSCMTTCPSGVDYMHLVDLARSRIGETGQRTLADRLLRQLLPRILPYPGRFALALGLARLARPMAPILPGRIRDMMRLAPAGKAGRRRRRTEPAEGQRRHRVALLPGCIQDVVAWEINDAAIRILRRHGCEVVVAEGSGCCGALDYHLGRGGAAVAFAEANLAAWRREMANGGLDAVIATASGCGTQLKDMEHVLRQSGEAAAGVGDIAGRARDVCEFLEEIGVADTVVETGLAVAYQAPCSLQHGQKITEAPVKLLSQAGFNVRIPAEPHLCCGSAGTYNLMQPEFARRLGAHKAARLQETECAVIATGNVGCMLQLSPLTVAPVVHTVQLLDWATGGPKPAAL